MLNREWGAEGNGKLPHIFIPSKIANLVLEFAEEEPVFGQNCSLGAQFAVNYLSLGRAL